VITVKRTSRADTLALATMHGTLKNRLAARFSFAQVNAETAPHQAMHADQINFVGLILLSASIKKK
jgi:hypothetical protein